MTEVHLAVITYVELDEYVSGSLNDLPKERAQMSAGLRRLNISVSDVPTIEQAQDLMARLHVGNADRFGNALELVSWIVGEVQLGRRIASMSVDGTSVREVTMPILAAARTQACAEPIESIAQQVVRIAKAAEPPTPALR